MPNQEDSTGPAWGPKDAHAILNHDIRRVDGPAKATGRARYTYDVRPPGMLHGLILISPYACAEVTSVDTGAAERMAGVKAVISLGGGRQVKYEGDPIAAVAAITPEIAEDAVRAIRVVFKPLPHVVTAEQAIRSGAPSVFQDASGQGNARLLRQDGDKGATEAALKNCAAVVEREFHITMQHHTCLETHGVTVDYRGGDTATVYASTQGTFTVPGEAAQELGLASHQAVTAVVEYMGGGFGSKFGLDLPGAWACRLSKKTGSPVKMMLTRPQEYLMAGNRSGVWQKVRAGVSRDGKLTAFSAVQYRLGGLSDGSQAGLPYIYHSDNVYREVYALYTNQDGSRAFRAPGHPEASFGMESLMDDAAHAIGMDPVEFRKTNVDDPAYHRQLDMGAKAIGWERRVPDAWKQPGYGPDKALRRGMGCACSTWGGGGGPQCKVDVFITPDGHVAVQVGTQDLGTGSRTLTAGIVAEEFGLPVSAVETRIGRSSYGMANASGGSTTTASLAPAVKDAAYIARMDLFAKVAPALKATPDQLAASGGRVYVAGEPGRGVTWKQACASLGMAGVSARGSWVPGLSGNGVHGAQFAEVEVDTGTGRLRVLKMVAVQDCGLCLNRLASESQINGGMINALGYALLEQTVADEFTGHMMNTSMDDYKLPGCMEMPELIPIIDDGDTRNVVIGMAEAPIIPGAGAIANAVFNATGVRVTSLPITPDRILDGLATRTEA